jgi:hypothetical protein
MGRDVTAGRYASAVERAITGFHQDDVGDWVAELECGHNQHVRHRPPFQVREWVVDDDSRRARVGAPLDCPLCDRAEMPLNARQDEGGDPACWAHILCPDCGAVLDGSEHRPGCPRFEC